MSFKIACHACGQHLTVTPEFSGTEQDCPTCGSSFVVPEDTEVSPVAEHLAEQVVALGIHCDLPADLDSETAEFALSEFLKTAALLRTYLEQWLASGDLLRESNATEMQLVHERLFKRMVQEGEPTTHEDLATLVFETLPYLCAEPQG
jgi:hypothetical protein